MRQKGHTQLVRCRPFRRAGDVRARLNANIREKPMNGTIRSEQVEPTAEVDNNAVSEVEEGIREFVRNDIAYLRRPHLARPESAPHGTPLESSESAVTTVTSLIQRVPRTSL